MDEGEVDLWAQFRFLRSELLGDNWWNFRRVWMRKSGFHHLKRQLKKHLIDRYMKILSPYVFQITRAEVMDVPKEEDLVVSFQLTGNAAKVYKQLEDGLYAEIDGKEIYAPMAAVNLAKLSQVSGGFLKTEDGLATFEQDKLATLLDWLEDYDVKTKIVIFAKFTAEIDALRKGLSRKRSVAVLDGRTKDESIWEEFQDKKDPAVIICQIDKAKESIELSISNLGIFYSKGFSYIAYNQARARLLGPKTDAKRRVLFAHFVAENTVDEDHVDVLQDKHWTALTVLNRLKQRRHR